MTETELIHLAAKHKLGRTIKPLGMQTGDVFVTDQSYRTSELLAFAAAVAKKETRAALDLKDAEIERLRDLLHRMLEAPATHIKESWKEAVRLALTDQP